MKRVGAIGGLVADLPQAHVQRVRRAGGAPRRIAGIVAVGELIAAPYIDAGTLVPIMTRYSLPPVGVFVVRPPSQHTPRKVRILIDFLVERFKQE